MGKSIKYQSYQIFPKQKIDRIIDDKLNQSILKTLIDKPLTLVQIRKKLDNKVTPKTLSLHLDDLWHIRAIGYLENNKLSKALLKTIFKMSWLTGARNYLLYTPTMHRIIKAYDIYYLQNEQFVPEKTRTNAMKVRMQLTSYFTLLELMRLRYIHKQKISESECPPKDKFKMNIATGKNFNPNPVFTLFLGLWFDDPYMRLIAYDEFHNKLEFQLAEEPTNTGNVISWFHAFASEFPENPKAKQLGKRFEEDFAKLP